MGAPNTLNAILKRVQSNYFDDKALVRKSNFMKWIAHKKDFHGASINFPVQFSGYGGASHDVSVADGYDLNGGYREFVVTDVRDYKQGTLDGSTTRKALKGDLSQKYVDYLKNEISNCYGALEARLAAGAFRSGTGSRGNVSSTSTIASATIFLANPDDALMFFVGDKVAVSATDGSALRNAGALVTLSGVDTSTGALTTAGGNWSTQIAAIATGDFVYKAGDAQNGTSVLTDYAGLQAWAPNTSPSATLFFGVDRSIAPEALAGLRFAGTGSTVESVLISAGAYAMRRPSFSFEDHVIVMSTQDFANLQIAKEGSRIVSGNDDNQYKIGIDMFSVGGHKVMADVFCPDGKFFLVGKGAFELHTNDGVQINDVDGNKIQRRSGDTYNFQTLVEGNFTAPKPYGILNGTWPVG